MTKSDFCTYQQTAETPPACDVCGEPADAAWVGMRTIAVCRDCAQTILPRVIADAVADAGIDTIRRAWTEAAVYYWRALAFSAR